MSSIFNVKVLNCSRGEKNQPIRSSRFFSDGYFSVDLVFHMLSLQPYDFGMVQFQENYVKVLFVALH